MPFRFETANERWKYFQKQADPPKFEPVDDDSPELAQERTLRWAEMHSDFDEDGNYITPEEAAARDQKRMEDDDSPERAQERAALNDGKIVGQDPQNPESQPDLETEEDMDGYSELLEKEQDIDDSYDPYDGRNDDSPDDLPPLTREQYEQAKRNFYN